MSGPGVTHTSSGESVPNVYTRTQFSLASRVHMLTLAGFLCTSRVQVCNTRAAVDKVSWLGLVRLDGKDHWPTLALQRYISLQR